MAKRAAQKAPNRDAYFSVLEESVADLAARKKMRAELDKLG